MDKGLHQGYIYFMHGNTPNTNPINTNSNSTRYAYSTVNFLAVISTAKMLAAAALLITVFATADVARISTRPIHPVRVTTTDSQ